MRKWNVFISVIAFVFLCVACSSSDAEDAAAEISGNTENMVIADNDIEHMEDETPLRSIKTGVYTFYNESAGSFLSYDGNAVILSDEAANWYINPYDDHGAYVNAGTTDLVLDIDNAWMREGTTIKIWNMTGYLVQIWNIQENDNGTFSFLSYEDNQFCLGFENGNAVLQYREAGNSMQEWEAVEITDENVRGYRTYVSDGGIIELQLPMDIENTISKDRINEWADNLETAYDTYYELTNYEPFEKMIVVAYKPSPYIGYVTYGSNVIHIDSTFIYEDLQKMAAREVDWNFCALHEMGHLFDQFRPWQFEAELMTDLKLAYVLEKNDVSAVPSEFDASQNFYGKDIINAYKMLGRDFSQTYDIFGCTARFLEIKEEIGWEPFKQTFYEMQENYDEYYTESKPEQLDNFVRLLSQYSGKDIKSYFSAGEWNAIMNKISSNE